MGVRPHSPVWRSSRQISMPFTPGNNDVEQNQVRPLGSAARNRPVAVTNPDELKSITLKMILKQPQVRVALNGNYLLYPFHMLRGEGESNLNSNLQLRDLCAAWAEVIQL
jgi:hypothetical protein